MGIEIQYRELFGIELVHDYFDDDLCTALVLTPTSDCVDRMTRSGYLFHAGIGNGAVWYSVREDVPPLRDFDGTTPFTFLLQTKDPYFLTYTSPDWGDGDLIGGGLYVNNLVARLQDVAVGNRQNMSAANGVVLPIRPHRFRHYFSSQGVTSVLTLHRAHDDAEVWRSEASAGQVDFADLDLLGIADGRYLLKRDGALESDFYLTNIRAEKLFGIVEVFPDSAGGLAETDRDGSNFALSFNRRESRWRYFLIDHGRDADLADVRITREVLDPTAATGHTFGRPEATTLRGKRAWVVESESPLPLLQSPATFHKIELHLQSNGGASSDPRRLPYATPGSTRPERTDAGTEMWSNIYVYL